MSRNRQRWELEHPEVVLRAIDAICPFAAGRVVVGVLAMETQELVDAAFVPEPPQPQACWDPYDASARLRDVVVGLMPQGEPARPGRGHVTHLLVTVVCREGRVIDTMAEHRWFRAWRYSNHLTSAIEGDVYVVTPHGWTGAMDRRADHHPRLRPWLALAPPAIA